MDLCTWDWGAIGSILGAVATLIAAGVALYIFTQWKNQKGSEIVAHEAKEAIKELLENMYTINILMGDLNEGEKISINRYMHYNDEINILLERLLFIEACVAIADFKNKIDSFSKNNTDFSLACSGLIKEICSDTRTTLLVEEQKLQGQKSIRSCFELIKTLQPYALYQARFIFKRPV